MSSITTYDDLLDNDQKAAEQANKSLEMAYIEYAFVMSGFMILGLGLSALALWAKAT